MENAETLQQAIFRRFRNAKWRKFDEGNKNDFKLMLGDFLVEKSEKDINLLLCNIFSRYDTSSYENGAVYTSILIMQFFPNVSRARDIEGRTFKMEQFELEKLIKIWKCNSRSVEDVSTGCCHYLDKFGRVYESWDDFKKNNRYTKGILVTPEDGLYRETEDNNAKVRLEYLETPALTMLSKWKSISNSFMDLIIGIIAFLILYQQCVFGEVNENFILAAETTTFASALYGWIVSSAQLSDVNKHQIKSAELFDLKAKRFFLHHVAIVLLSFARLFTFFINMAKDSGYSIGTDYKMVHEIIVGVSILASGLAITINCVLLIKSVWKNGLSSSKTTTNDESLPTSLEVFMLLSSILFFFNIYAKVYGTNFLSYNFSQNGEGERPDVAGRGRGERGGRKPDAAAKPSEKDRKDKLTGEKILTFDGTHGLFLVMSFVFVPIFIPWLPIINFV